MELYEKHHQSLISTQASAVCAFTEISDGDVCQPGGDLAKITLHLSMDWTQNGAGLAP